MMEHDTSTGSADQTLVQKIIRAKVGRPVAVGEVLAVTPDVALSHDDSAEIARLFAARGGRQIADPDLHVIVLQGDPTAGEAIAAAHQEIRSFVEAQGIENFYDVQSGIAAHVLIEQGFALPGRLIVSSSPHTLAVGALGALALSVAPATLADLMATGRIDLCVPAVVRLEVGGRLADGVAAHDLIMHVGGAAASAAKDGDGRQDVEGHEDRPEGPAPHGFCRGLVLEFSGPAVSKMTVAGRLALCSLAGELGAAAAYVSPDARTLAYLNGRARGNFDLLRGDAEAPAARTLTCDGDVLGPQVAGPNVTGPLRLAAGTPVDVVVLGGCAGGQLADLRAAAVVLRGRRVASGLRLFILPVSAEVLRGAVRDGTLLTLLEAGAVLLGPGCGPCQSELAALLAPGEAALTCTPVRTRRRRDGPGAPIYHVSPLTCAASALVGRIADPRDVVDAAALASAASEEA